MKITITTDLNGYMSWDGERLGFDGLNMVVEIETEDFDEDPDEESQPLSRFQQMFELITRRSQERMGESNDDDAVTAMRVVALCDVPDCGQSAVVLGPVPLCDEHYFNDADIAAMRTNIRTVAK